MKIVASFCVVVAAFIAARALHRCAHEQGTGALPESSRIPAPDPGSTAPTPAFEVGRSGALSSHEPAEAAPGAPAPLDTAAMPSPMTRSGVLLATDGEAFQPTPEGLYARTTELWAQEEFLNLSKAEVEKLLGDDFEAMDVRDFLASDLPTLDDCRIGLRDPDAQRLLLELCIFDAALAALWEVPIDRRAAGAAAMIDATQRSRDRCENILMRRLREETTYPHWELLARLYREWEK